MLARLYSTAKLGPELAEKIREGSHPCLPTDTNKGGLASSAPNGNREEPHSLTMFNNTYHHSTSKQDTVIIRLGKGYTRPQSGVLFKEK